LIRLRVASSLSNSWTKEPIEAVDSGPALLPMPDRHYANRSLSTAEPVSAPPKRKLENGEQRPAPETRAQRTEIPEIARQRPEPASLIRGEINDFHRPGKISQGFEPPHGGIKIRTFLTKNNSLHVWMAATPHLGTKGLTRFLSNPCTKGLGPWSQLALRLLTPPAEPREMRRLPMP
jgi:hypothetical protein